MNATGQHDQDGTWHGRSVVLGHALFDVGTWRLIGEVFVKVLCELNKKRQVIVLTNDPNIVVGADAEQVVVLDADSDRNRRVIETGRVDQPEIIEAIIGLLEGGREAFEVPNRRYNDDG